MTSPSLPSSSRPTGRLQKDSGRSDVGKRGPIREDQLPSDEQFFRASAAQTRVESVGSGEEHAMPRGEPVAGSKPGGVKPGDLHYGGAPEFGPYGGAYLASRPAMMMREPVNQMRPRLTLELPWYFELIAVVITALAISSLVRTFLLQPFYIPSASMEDTLMINDSVLVTKMAPRYRPLNRGDIVVFEDTEKWLHGERENYSHGKESNVVVRGFKRFLIFVGLAPEDSEGYLIKRVIGLGDDNVACCDEDGMMTINGKAIDENYIPPTGSSSDIEFDVTVPKNSLWVMGDNRNHSADSRSHMNSKSGGFVPLKDVVGRAFVVVWPLEHMRFISTSCAFYNIPQPAENPVDSFSSSSSEVAQ